ncbi:MAG: hypothetical protein EOP05_19665 [Proteobacteria bacterium]|nr:MAG: hypothetical protein EOP05_19665 [Pseudomonadota bacterium]
MKRSLAIALSALFVGSVGFAADAENKAETTTDVSKNPITGTVTTTKKTAAKKKGAHGKASMETTEKTKVHKDGEVEKSVEVEGESAHK